MIDKLRNLPIIQMGMLTFLILNVSISFSIFSSLQPLSYLVWGICVVSFAILSVMFIRKLVVTFLDACMLFYLLLLVVFTIMSGTELKMAIYKSIEVGLLILIINYWEKP